MLRRPPRSTRTDTLFPYTTLFRSAIRFGAVASETTGPGSTISIIGSGMSWAAAEETGSRINGVGMTTSGFGSGFASCRSAFSGPSGTSRTGSGGASKLRKLTTTGGEGEIMTLSATCQPSIPTAATSASTAVVPPSPTSLVRQSIGWSQYRVGGAHSTAGTDGDSVVSGEMPASPYA